MHFNTFITLTDISKCISIFSNQIEFEEVYLHSWVLAIRIFLNNKNLVNIFFVFMYKITLFSCLYGSSWFTKFSQSNLWQKHFILFTTTEMKMQHINIPPGNRLSLFKTNYPKVFYSSLKMSWISVLTHLSFGWSFSWVRKGANISIKESSHTDSKTSSISKYIIILYITGSGGVGES